jgi:Ion channel
MAGAETQGKKGVVRSLRRAIAACERFRDPGLSALLMIELLLIFVVGPLAAGGVELPILTTATVTVGFVFVLVLASHRSVALITVIAAALARSLAAILEFLRVTSVTEAVNSISAVVGLLAVIWVIARVVFGPGRITSHRVRGAVVLYLTVALVFAWTYRLISELIPGSFFGLAFRPGGFGTVSPFVYYSLTTLTTLGFGDITPVHAIARGLTTLEAVIGQLYPAIVLARILTLYSGEPRRDR